MLFDRVLARSTPLENNHNKYNMSAHRSKFNAFDGRCDSRGGLNRGREGTTNKNMRRTVDKELEGKLGFDLFTKVDPHLGWILTITYVSYLYSTIFSHTLVVVLNSIAQVV
jgi:hypothetical protein